ncbi:trypsin-like peptidase domain-containing protein, partial [bacterium]|nr:trypsin-like peptidase domain-containing protein [bacterium]
MKNILTKQMKLLQIVPFVFAMLLFSQNNIAEYEQLGETFADVAAKVTKSVVVIESETVIKNPHANQQFDDFFRFFQFDMPEEFRREALGSGVIVREDGVILTNNHVVENAEDIRVVLHDGRKYDAKIIGKDPKSDVAVIQIDEKNLPAISLGDSDKIRVGHWVLAIGSP